MKLKTINPTTGDIIKSYDLFNEREISEKIENAHQAFLTWKETDFKKREECMLHLARSLQEKKQTLAKLIVQEMGKPISLALSEIEKCAWVCEHFAKEAENYLAPRSIQTEMKKTFVCYKPLGTVFAIMPWNFPFWQVFRFAAPTIMAGNAAILKHAPITTGSGNQIAALFLEAGFPDNLFQHFILDNALAARVIAHPRIVAVTLTGSNRAGSEVSSTASKYLKKSVLELGGNDPYIVLDDANLTIAAKAIVNSRLNNCGQVCIAAKRIIAVSSIYEELIKAIKPLMETFTMGDPSNLETKLGPMAREDLRTNLHKQVIDSINLGAKLEKGGQIPNGKGYYYPPTLLTNVRQGMPAFDDELFGPVISVIEARDETHAIELANESVYGLAACVFTQDLAKGERIARDQIEAGTCFVNALVSSDPRVPFGGIKQSGFGRELSLEGILEFVNIKTVSIYDETSAE